MSSAKFWRYLTYFWTVVLYIAAIYDFISDNVFSRLLGPLAAIYVAVLAVYVSQKEFERWSDSHFSRHPGEIFVIAWTILVFILVILDLCFDKKYHFPDALLYTYVTVLSVLAITAKSKINYKTKHHRKRQIKGVK